MARLCGGGRGLGGLGRAWRGGRGPGGRGQALQSPRKAQAGTPACRPQRWTEERPPTQETDAERIGTKRMNTATNTLRFSLKTWEAMPQGLATSHLSAGRRSKV